MKILRFDYFLVPAAIVCLLIPEPAYAYIEPGTGSLIVQALIAGFAGLGVVLKLGWARLFGSKSSAPSVTSEASEDASSTTSGQS